ncbi:MAG: hypothetical protein WAO55_08930 [Candidatus Manganitrophaceae bacterium]
MNPKIWAKRTFPFFSLFFPALAVAAENGDLVTAAAHHPAWIIGTILFLLIIVVGFFWYLHTLQQRFLDACKEDKQLPVFLQAPFGLPTGSVRSVIALMIVTISLFFIVLQVFLGVNFPEGLTTLLGTIIGFYFGSRSTSGQQGEGTDSKVAELKEAHGTAVAEKETGQAQALLKKVEKGVALTKTALNLLPESMQKKYGDTLSKLEEGIATAENLIEGGKTLEAVNKAGELFEAFKGGNPVKEIVSKASLSFGRVLGGSVPQLALIFAIVGVGSKLVGVTYQKWKARILHAPFSPSVIPLEVVDANTGFVLFLQCAIFKTVFARELEENDRPFIKSAIDAFLKEETDPLWEKYKGRFESRQQFEEGLEEFRRAAANIELKRAIDPKWVAEVGGYESLVSAVDKLDADPEARGDLDALVLVTEGLQRSGEPVQTIFEKVREGVSNGK